MRVSRPVLRWLAILFLLAVVGCTEPYVGAPSFSFMSVASTDGRYEPIGPVREQSDCTTTYLVLFGGGDVPSHEVALSRLLAASKADVILNARVTTDRVSLLLYTRTCATVRGQPARLVGASS